MRRREYVHSHKRKHISNRHLADRYFYAGEHDTVTRISLTQYNADILHTRRSRQMNVIQKICRREQHQLVPD